jgi:O-acetylserine/cysteine efflux transporter
MNARDTFLVVLTTLIWGFNFVVIKWGIQDVSAPMMTALRFALVAIPLVFFVRRPKMPLAIIATYGLLFGCGIWGLVNFAISLGTPAGQASLLLQSSAFMTVIAGILLFSEEMSGRKVVGILLALVGFILIAKGAFETNTVWGVGLVILAGLSWTICNVIIRAYKPADILSFIVWSSLFVPIPIFLYLSLFTSELTHGLNISGWRGITSILFQAGITTVLGYGIWTNMISKYGLAMVSPYSLLVPVSGLIFAWILFGETAEPIELIGSALVLIGLAVMSGTVSTILARLKLKESQL